MPTATVATAEVFAEVDAFMDGLASAPRSALIEAVGLWGYHLPPSKPKALSFIRDILENYLKSVQRCNF